MIDLSTITEWSEETLDEVVLAAEREKERRSIILSAEKQMDNLIWDYSSAIGRKHGDVWTQPTGAHDAYPIGIVVTHGSTEWVSLIPGNVWEPGVSGWREYVEPSSGVIPLYRRPTGAHDAYMTGDRIIFRGKSYESIMGSIVYSPEEYPLGWTEVFPEEDPEDLPVDPEVPVEPPEETVPEFVQPTGAHNAYAMGDRVLFDGVVYESAINANTYSPSSYPAGWITV